ncbi:hypothetical protein FJT64_013708 [Amphibalanus amphitrite]|uniref:Uncharacterized protein n=1 Tax=Amphibalanus amphitrite TaxID=1232801 RepID=A0A6A4V2Q0_AMPAM|nr:hypothetical protein FJT64_013708 [Amphibalanus amphitrite]
MYLLFHFFSGDRYDYEYTPFLSAVFSHGLRMSDNRAEHTHWISLESNITSEFDSRLKAKTFISRQVETDMGRSPPTARSVTGRVDV